MSFEVLLKFIIRKQPVETENVIIKFQRTEKKLKKNKKSTNNTCT